jgi:protein phosphatase
VLHPAPREQPENDQTEQRALLTARGILPVDDQPPFDIMGDVHGCFDELEELLATLGYVPAGDGFTHPEGRRLAFVGDLVDRGPAVIQVLRAVEDMVERGEALFVIGNHDAKALRWLRGHGVRVANGLAATIQQFEALPANEQRKLREHTERLFATAPAYLLLDGGNLVITHGAIIDDMIGHWNDEIARLCMYGDVIGYTTHGKPIRRNWAAQRELPDNVSAPYIVYGHTVVERAEWVNRALDLDTGCVYGGQLSALRYPEMEIVQVPARRTYASRK